MMASAASRWIDSQFKSKNVTGQMECADLTPSVGKQLVAANRAANHLVDVFRRLILTVDFLIFLVGKLGGDEARVPGDSAELVGSRGGVGNRADLGADNGNAERSG